MTVVCVPGQVRLADSVYEYEYEYDYYGQGEYGGRLEIHHDGRWGTVCDDGFSDVDAQVVCR